MVLRAGGVPPLYACNLRVCMGDAWDIWSLGLASSVGLNFHLRYSRLAWPSNLSNFATNGGEKEKE